MHPLLQSSVYVQLPLLTCISETFQLMFRNTGKVRASLEITDHQLLLVRLKGQKSLFWSKLKNAVSQACTEYQYYQCISRSCSLT